MKRLSLLLALCIATITLSAQQTTDPVIFEVGNQKIYKSEFMREFLRSIGQDPSAKPTACTYEKRQALEEYVDLYVNFRAKLADAYARGYDTMSSLCNELATYRKELVAPYLIDSATRDRILAEAYERNHYAVHAAHILVLCDPAASPADTLKAYNKALEARSRVLSGENFFEVSKQVAESQMTPQELDKARSRRSNGRDGDLGFFTVFNMIYPFENACYNMQPDEVSMPVRTQYGYHIIKLFDRVPYYGKCTISHIWCSSRHDYSESNIHKAYERLKSGADFGQVARNYSDDRATSDKGGSLGSLVMQQIPYEYMHVIGNGLKPGQFSEPFQTEHGWHIIRLDRIDTIPPFEKMLPKYNQNLAHDLRNDAPQQAFIEEAKKHYNFVDYTATYGSWTKAGNIYTFVPEKKITKKSHYASNLNALAAALDDRVFSNSWVYNEQRLTDHTPLFAIGDQTYTAHDLAVYIAQTQSRVAKQDLLSYAALRYKEFVNNRVLDYADRHLENDNAELRSTVDEYRHGLMIFAYNDDQIWSKAIDDTAGYAAFYERESAKHSFDNPDDSIYFWNTRARVTVYTVANSDALGQDKAVKIINRAIKKGKSSNDIRLELVNEIDAKQYDANGMVSSELKIIADGDNSLLAKNEWKPGLYTHRNGAGYQVCIVEQIMPPQLKSKVEARGYYINDYQNELERQLIEQLREKYHVTIHQNVIDEIAY